MSRVTNNITEQSVSCGFFNSDGVAGTRKYYASEMSAIFDGIIQDGVFASIGTAFAVKAHSGNTVNVGVGKCWFNHTWTLNDAVLPVNCGDGDEFLDRAADPILNRIDAIVIEVNQTDAVQDNFIKFVKGTPATDAVRPTMTKEDRIHQYPLCYIYRKAGSTEIKQADITNMIGTEETPFITGILQTVSLDQLLGQWQDELDQFVAAEKADVDKFITDQEVNFNTWYEEMKQLMSDVMNELDTWTNNQKTSFLAWFDSIKKQLSTDAAGNLQLQIDEDEVERILMIGLPDCTKTISDDGTVIASVDSSNRTLLKTFTNNFLTSTSELIDENNRLVGRLVKTFSPDGKQINSTLTIM